MARSLGSTRPRGFSSGPWSPAPRAPHALPRAPSLARQARAQKRNDRQHPARQPTSRAPGLRIRESRMAGRVPPATHFRMSQVRRHGTEPELLVCRILRSLGWPFRLHVKSLPGCPDIVLPDHGTVLRVHGCFWHGHHCKRGRVPTTNESFWTAKIGRNRSRDRSTQRRLRALGWRVVTLWECRLRAWPAKRLATLLQRLKRRDNPGRPRKAASSHRSARRSRSRRSPAPGAGARHSRSVPARPSFRP
jgi:DNA mismatch endonuclease, patch repair protein